MMHFIHVYIGHFVDIHHYMIILYLVLLYRPTALSMKYDQILLQFYYLKQFGGLSIRSMMYNKHTRQFLIRISQVP